MFWRNDPPPPPQSVFNSGTIVNVFGIPILTAALIGTGFYFTTRDELQRHDVAIAKDDSAREALRNEFLESMRKTADGIGEINKHSAVQDEQVKQTISALDKISVQLDSFRNSVSVQPAGRPR